jgi:hypothetical protein
MKWWSDTQAGLSRNGCKTEHCFTPLYELLQVRQQRNRRSSPSPERTGEQLWVQSLGWHVGYLNGALGGLPLPFRGRHSMRMVERCRCTSMQVSHLTSQYQYFDDSLNRGIWILMTLRKNQISKNVLPVNNHWWWRPNITSLSQILMCLQLDSFTTSLHYICNQQQALQLSCGRYIRYLGILTISLVFMYTYVLPPLPTISDPIAIL